MSGEIQLSQAEKWLIGGFSTAGAIGLPLAGIVAPRHIIAAIWILATSLLIYVIVFWISSRDRIRHRTPIAAVMGVVVLAACASWNYAETRSSRRAQGQPASAGSVNVQQNTSGAGSVAVNGNGNSVNTNVAPPQTKPKKGEKQ